MKGMQIACTESGPVRSMPFKIDPVMNAETIMAADTIGRDALEKACE